MPSDFGRSTSRPSSARASPAALAIPRDRDSPSSSPVPSPAAAAAAAAEPASPASPSARPKDVVDSYLRQLYGGNTETRVLAAQGLGAMPSFLSRSQAPNALKAAVDLGVVNALVQVLKSDEELPVQEACLMALASLLLATAPYEEHSAPLKPPHLKQLGACILRPDVLTQIGYVLTSTGSSRVVLAAARVVTIMAPYVTQSTDVYILDSQIVPALLKATATATPAPGQRPPSGAASAAATPRDAAACALALLVLAQASPDLYTAVRTADFFQAIAVLYQRCIDPDQPSVMLLPADAAALLLRAVTMEPNPSWAGSLPKGYRKRAEMQLEECDALECLVSYVAVEAGNLRQLGEDVAATVAENARAVIEKNGLELEHLQAQLKERQRQTGEAKEAAREARRAVEEAEVDAAAAHEGAEAADAIVRAARNGGNAAQRQARRNAEVEATRADELVEERRAALAVAEAQVAELRADVTALRRSAAPVRWQGDRMARMAGAAQAWVEQHGAKGKSKVRITKPNFAMLTQVLAYLSARVKPPPAPERGVNGKGRGGSPALPATGPSPEHVAAVQAKLLDGGLAQAMVRLSTVLSAVRALADELAALAGDLALYPDMAGALGGAAEVLGREAAALAAVNQRAELRRKQVNSEVVKLRKALKLGFPQGSPRRHAELGPGNGLSKEVRQEDVERRLKAAETEAEELSSVLQDSEALVSLLQERLQAVTAAATNLTECHASFVKAFPSQAAPSTPATAPAAAPGASPATNTSGAPPGASPGRAISLASQHIMAKDPSHPAGHLLGLLSRSLMPVTQGASNLAALIRQLQGRPPEGGGATWPPPGATRPSSASDGGSRLGASGTLRGRSGSVGSAGPTSRPGSARGYNSTGGAGRMAGGQQRPSSARSAGGGGVRQERSAASGVGSPRASGGGGYGLGFSSSGYGGGYGGFSGFPGAGPFPVDGQGRPMRYPLESMYGTIQATFSPLRGFSTPHNGPRLTQSLREKALRASAASAASAAALKLSAASGLTAESAFFSADPLASSTGSMPVADESRRVVNQAISSVLFDPIDPDVLGPGVVRMSNASITLANSVASRQAVAYGSRRSTTLDSRTGTGAGAHALGGEGSALSSPRSTVYPSESVSQAGDPTPGGAGAGGAATSDMSVLDALLMQTELLCSVFNALSTLQQFARTTSRTCFLLPASVSFAPLHPGGLGAYMAPLHSMWVEAISHHPDMRVQVTQAVTQIAELALVPPGDYEVVYKDTGMVAVLVRMLAGQLRPSGKLDAGKAGEEADSPSRSRTSGASPGSNPDGSPKPRYVGRLTATAPPTLRLGPVQQAEQAAAAQALRAISHAQSEVLASIGQDDKLLARMSSLCLDHSMSWTARSAAADLLADLVLGGGPAAEAAVASGAYAGLVETINRDMYPFFNQDPRMSKESVVSALACLVAHPELLEGVVEAAQAPSGPSSGLPLNTTEQAMSAILRSLWSICRQVYSTFTTDRTGNGRHVDIDLIEGLLSTATTAARELAVLADTVPEARRALNVELGLGRKINAAFVQAIKDATLQEALLELQKNLS